MPAWSSKDVAALLPDPGERSLPSQPTPPADPEFDPSNAKKLAENRITPVEAERLRALARELARRRVEALTLYEPLPVAEQFHKDTKPEVLVYGSNRSGKTTTVAVEIARAVTGQDPYGKYPLKDGRCYIVGYDLSHNGEVLWRKLGRPGAFQIIWDDRIEKWRPVKQQDPWDFERKKKWKPAPPLIPPRMIEKISWEKQGQLTPAMVRLKNGWEIKFCSSKAVPGQGMDINLAWFDEEIVNDAWYNETSARLTDREGRFFWSATPLAGTEQLFELYNRYDRGDEAISAYFLSLEDNAHITEKAKQELIHKYEGDDYEYKTRILGQFAILGLRIFPEWDVDGRHGIDEWRGVQLARGEDVPPEWTKYLFVDPGHQLCACLFAAVPPDDDIIILYGELCLRDCDAEKFGEAVRLFDQDAQYERMTIDHQAGRMTQIAAGKTVEEQYVAALKSNGVTDTMGQTTFWPGSDDVKGRILAVKSLLKNQKCGYPGIVAVRGKLPHFEREIMKYRRKKKPNGEVVDEPVAKDNHLMDCLGYLAMDAPVYVKPPPTKRRSSWVQKALDAKRQRMRRQEQQMSGKQHGYVRLGPGR